LIGAALVNTGLARVGWGSESIGCSFVDSSMGNSVVCAGMTMAWLPKARSKTIVDLKIAIIARIDAFECQMVESRSGKEERR